MVRFEVPEMAAFVQQVAAELGLAHLRGVHARVEGLSERYDIVSSRAFASLVELAKANQPAAA